jgi:hypothetical protein
MWRAETLSWKTYISVTSALRELDQPTYLVPNLASLAAAAASVDNKSNLLNMTVRKMLRVNKEQQEGPNEKFRHGSWQSFVVHLFSVHSDSVS